jgi:CBS domain-containing protein
MRYDIWAFFYALVALAIGWALVRGVKGKSSDFQGSDWAALLIPTVVYLVFSGTLTEFKAGGFEAKLQSRAQAPVPSGIISSAQIVGADAPAVDLPREVVFGRAQRVVAVRLGDWANVTNVQREGKAMVVAVAIYQSMLAGSFAGLVVLDDVQRPLGFFEASFFLDLLRIPLDRLTVPSSHVGNVLTNDQVRSRVLETNLWLVLQYPKERAEAEGNKEVAAYDITRIDALKLMTGKRLDALPVVDSSRRFMGVLARRDLVDQMLLDMIAATQSK